MNVNEVLSDLEIDRASSAERVWAGLSHLNTGLV
jgi:hypothetical protein